MPPSLKRASVATHDKLAKKAKSANPATITRVPKWAKGLTDVVVAFENRDTDALHHALDAADPMLLNHIPKCWLSGEWHGLDFVNPNRDQCFFNAFTDKKEGHRPLSLVSSATYMLARTWKKRHPLKHKGHHRDDWTSVYRVLVNHHKIDVNAYLGEGTTYVTYNRSGPVDERPPARFFQHTWPTLNGEESKDDGMRPWDYACMIRDRERGTTNSGYARNLISILIESGKLAPTGADLIDMFMLAMPPHEPVSGDILITDQMTDEIPDDIPSLGEKEIEGHSFYFLKLMRQAEIPALRHLVEIMDRDMNNIALIPYRRHCAKVFRRAVMKRWAFLRRRQVLRRVRAIARAHIVTVRWWTLAREAAYTPGGAGFLRAHISYDAASGGVQAVA